VDCRRLSESLHERVRAFITQSLAGRASETFDALALAIARFQAAQVPPIQRLTRARGIDLDTARVAESVPAVPCDVFRFTRVAGHPREDDERVFRTSGTSLGQGSRGEHPLRTTATYELGALGWGRAMLWPDTDRLRCLVLAPSLLESPDSSLSFMLDRFAAHLGGPASFHVRSGELDVAGVARSCDLARRSGEPTLVLGTSFAWVHLLDAAAGRDLTLPPASRAMQTGGFKGRSRQVSPAELRRSIASALGIAESHVIGEYGMTELSSQLYEATLALAVRPQEGDVHAALLPRAAAHGIYVAPPWMRVTAVDPSTLATLGSGEIGIARIVDLANVDSAVAVQTSDLVRILDEGVELLGRAPGAPPRGCSLAMDEMLSGERI